MSKNNARQRRPRRQEVRERLIAAAANVLSERGYEASVEEISERAGFSRGAFYSNFDTKERLFLAAVQARTQERVRELQEALSDSDNVWELVERLGTGRRNRSPWREFTSHMQFLFHALARSDLRPELAQMERVRQRLFAEAAARILRQLGTDVDRLEELGRVLSALDHGLAVQAYLEERRVPVDLGHVVRDFLRLAAQDSHPQQR